MIALRRAYEFSAISGWSKTSTLLTTNIRTDAVYNSIPLTNLPQGEDANPDEFGAFLGAKFAMTADCTDLLCTLRSAALSGFADRAVFQGVRDEPTDITRILHNAEKTLL